MSVVICGGYIKTPGYAIFGPMAEDLFKHTLADICFLSVDSLNINEGLSYNFLDSVAVKKQMIKDVYKRQRQRFSKCSIFIFYVFWYFSPHFCF